MMAGRQAGVAGFRNLKKWMLTLAIPEHCIMWPLVVCLLRD